MSLNINFFFTSPVEAVRVTPKNLEEVAKWCGGRVAKTESRKVKGRMDSYVWVPTPDGSKISWAFPGMWITKRLAITESNEIKETYSVFRKDYFNNNYFEEPAVALEETWGRAQKERETAARQARTIVLELPEGADVEAAKAEILAKFTEESNEKTETEDISPLDGFNYKTAHHTGYENNQPLSPVEQRQLIIEDAVESESEPAPTAIAFSNDPRQI